MAKNGTKLGTWRTSLPGLVVALGALLLAAAPACSGETTEEPGGDASAVEDTGGNGTTNTNTAVVSPGTFGTTSGMSFTVSGGLTGTTGSTADSTSSGDGGSGGVTSGSSTSGQGGSAGEGSGGSAGSPGSTSTGQGGEAGESGTSGNVSIVACEDGMAASCPNGTPLCAALEGFGTGATNGTSGIYSVSSSYTFCTQTCESVDDCNFDLSGVSAAPVCDSFDGSSESVCSLDCSLGRTCPEGMECYSNVCMYFHCTCSGACSGSECN